MLFDDYLIFGVVWFSGWYFFWYAGAVMADPALYRISQMRHLGAVRETVEPLPYWWRISFALFALSDLIALYLIIRGYWREPSLWGVFLTHIGLAPRYIVRFVYPIDLRRRRRERIAKLSDSHINLTAVASLLVGALIFVTYYRL